MSELTPTPAEHRKVYYDALLAGRAEAQRLGYGLIDDRVFAALHRALYRPMVDLIVADTRRKVAEEIGPYVWIAPGRLGGKPCIGGHRIDVDRIVRHVWVDGVDSVQIPYPDLTRPKVLTACWYVGLYGTEVWSRRGWRAWAALHGDAMWSGRWDEVPDPPTRAAAIARGSGNGDSGQHVPTGSQPI